MAVEKDLELLRLVAAGDLAAFERFYRRFVPRLTRFVSRLTSRADVVEETVNDTMVVVWQKAGDFRGESRVSTWVLGIAYRLTLKALRRVSREPEESRAETPTPVDPDHPESHLTRRQGRERIRWALGRLSADHRAVVELTFFENCSYQEIAEIVGCPENTVKTRMFHARQRLRRLLGEDDRTLGPSRRDHERA